MASPFLITRAMSSSSLGGFGTSLFVMMGVTGEPVQSKVPAAYHTGPEGSITLGGALFIFLLSPVAILIMLIITNADILDKSGILDKRQFHSRFAHMLTENAPSTYFVCIFAMLAESVGHVFMPDFGYFYHIDLSLTFVNLTGVFMGGIAAQYEYHGGAVDKIASAFNAGFVAAYTSFCFFILHSSELTVNHHDGSHVLAMPYLLSNFVLGPVLFECGKALASTWAPIPMKPAPTAPHNHPHVSMCKRIVLAANFCILAIEHSRAGLWGSNIATADGSVALVVGWFMVSVACVMGDVVSFMCKEVYDHATTQVNWGTWGANALSLTACLFGLIATRCPPIKSTMDSHPFSSCLLDKFVSSFCGALSGFGAFSEDIAQSMEELSLIHI